VSYAHWRSVQSGIIPTVVLASAISGTVVETARYVEGTTPASSAMVADGARGVRRSDATASQAPVSDPIGETIERTRGRSRKLLEPVRERTAKDNWDGDGSPPGKAVIKRTERLLDAILDRLPAPDIMADNDGSLALDWAAGRGWTISISVQASGKIGYAALRDGQRDFGVFSSPNDPPVGLIDLVEGVINKRA
jgi:hypothetical protein